MTHGPVAQEDFEKKVERLSSFSSLLRTHDFSLIRELHKSVPQVIEAKEPILDFRDPISRQARPTARSHGAVMTTRTHTNGKD